MKNRNLRKISCLKASLVVSIGLAAAPVFALSPLPIPVWTVQDGKLLDPNGQPFIFRGVTIDHTLDPQKTVQAIKDAASLGANSAQIEFPIKPDGQYPRKIIAELKEIINTCKTSKLVCVLEPNDAAGYYEVAGSDSPATVTSYWTWGDLRDVLNAATGNIIIGLNNNPLGSIITPQEYADRMRYAIADLKSVYPYHVVMVDGSNWSQDTDKAMQKLAADNVQSGGAYKNVIYSVDMFDAYVNPELVRNYIESFTRIKAPLVIGGFAITPYYHPHFAGPLPQNAPRLPAESVMQYAEQYGAGYFGWSWSGNKNAALDIVRNWNVAELTAWGKLLINGDNGIRETAKIASVYNSNSSSSSSSSADVNHPPIANFEAFNYPVIFCGSPNAGRGSITARATGSSDPDGDELTFEWRMTGGLTEVASGYEVSLVSENRRSYQLTLTVSDGRSGVTSITKNIAPFYLDCPFTSSSSSIKSSSSVPSTSSSVPPISSSSAPSTSSVPSTSSIGSSSSVRNSVATCAYVISNQWSTGFVAAIRIKNIGNQPIVGWEVNWQYADGSKVSNLWNATLSTNGSYSAKNLNWNSIIQPGQTIEFGFQGNKPSGNAVVPVVTGNLCK